MFQIVWKDADGRNMYTNTMNEHDTEAYVEVLKSVGIEPTVFRKTEKTQTEKKRYVKVRFNGGAKLYTYLCKEKVNVGNLVVVWTSDGRELVTVVECGEATDAELEAICPLSKFKYIRGRVVAA